MKNLTQNCIRGPRELLAPHQLWGLLLLALSCALYGSFAAAQEMNPQSDVQQPQPASQNTGNQGTGQQPGSANQPGNAQACYLGGTGPVPTAGRNVSQMQSLTGLSSQDQEPTSEDAEQPTENSTGQQDAGNASSQPVMLASEIITILQQEPELVNSLRNTLAQGFGIDPTTIPDEGVYNCIQRDPSFRSEATAQLELQGFIPSTTTRQTAPSRQTRQTPGTRPQPAEQPSDIRTEEPIPYRNLPSLINLYAQDVAATGNLRRFGSDTFKFGTGNANELPMDLPVGPDYVLGPGDNLTVNMWGGQSNRLNRIVDRQGQIELPDAGTVTVAGRTIGDAESVIQKALSGQFQNEHVEISLGRVRTVRVYVVGDVQRPGPMTLALCRRLSARYTLPEDRQAAGLCGRCGSTAAARWCVKSIFTIFCSTEFVPTSSACNRAIPSWFPRSGCKLPWLGWCAGRRSMSSKARKILRMC